MMNSWILAALLSAPLTWQQIDLDQKLVLNEPVALDGSITLPKGTQLEVNDLIPLDDIRVLSYFMKITPCKAPIKDAESEMTIVNDLYGFQLEKDCVLEVFTEFNDLSRPSLFSLQIK